MYAHINLAQNKKKRKMLLCTLTKSIAKKQHINQFIKRKKNILKAQLHHLNNHSFNIHILTSHTNEAVQLMYSQISQDI